MGRLLPLLILLACLPAPARERIRLDDHIAEARERMSCRSEALAASAERIRQRRMRLPKEKGGRDERPPRIVPTRPQPKPTVERR